MKRVFPISVAFIITLFPTLSGQAPKPINKTKLAGVAIFPERLSADWHARQRDPKLDEEAKIKSTIETFFIIKYESWVKGELLDFGFLFDQADPRASEDYAYERSLMFYLLEGYKYADYLLARYDYRPNFYDLAIDGDKAKVAMRPKGTFVERKRPNKIENSVWTDYQFSLERLDGIWLIKSVSCDDENHAAYPHGTDFAQLASSIPEREKEYEAWEREHQRALEADPEYRERLEMLRKKSKGYEGCYESENKPLLCIKLAEGGILVATSDGDFDRALLEEIRGNPDEFNFIAGDHEQGRVKFVRDGRGRVIKCQLTLRGISKELIRSNNQ